MAWSASLSEDAPSLLREYFDVLAARCGLFLRAAWIVSPDQARVLRASPMTSRVASAQRVDRRQDLGKLGIAPPRHGQHAGLRRRVAPGSPPSAFFTRPLSSR